MDIKHHESGHKGLFYYKKDTHHIAELSYTVAEDEHIVLEHTSVVEEFRGQGLGKSLIYYAVEYVRQNNLEILPKCPYAKSVFRRYPDLQDVISKE
ncbi:MAG: N-acetyltransferase [Balneolaceae bacterium]|nr:N-acetyltransferase [Balneolaceae bacterium]